MTRLEVIQSQLLVAFFSFMIGIMQQVENVDWYYLGMYFYMSAMMVWAMLGNQKDRDKLRERLCDALLDIRRLKLVAELKNVKLNSIKYRSPD